MAGLSLPIQGESFRREGAHFATLKVKALPIPAMQVAVTAGGFWLNGQKWVQCSGGVSGLFTAPTANARWSLIYLDFRGTIQIVNGVASNDPVLPDCPRNGFPIGAVLIQSNSTAITAEMIVDVRGVYSTSPFSHRDLNDNDYPNIHTVDSITGLTTQLSTFVQSSEMPNMLSGKADIDGTRNESFIINKDATGVPTDDLYLMFGRGALPNVGIRFNETSNLLEFTHDGSVWTSFDTSDVGDPYVLPTASGSTLGGLKIGSGLAIDPEGVVSVDQSQLTPYSHPATHPASMIDQDTSHMFVSEAEKALWDAKAEAADYWTKSELSDNAGDSSKVHWSQIAGVPSFGSQVWLNPILSVLDLSNISSPVEGNCVLVQDDGDGKAAQYCYSQGTWVKIADVDWQPLSDSAIKTAYENNTDTNAFTDAEKVKLAGLENYVLPSSLPATIITEDETHRFVTDVERSKLTNIEENANNYVLPSSLPATIITEDETHRFVTDVEKSAWTSKLDGAYTPANPSDWTGTAPTTIQEALDRIASAINSIEPNVDL